MCTYKRQERKIVQPILKYTVLNIVWMISRVYHQDTVTGSCRSYIYKYKFVNKTPCTTIYVFRTTTQFNDQVYYPTMDNIQNYNNKEKAIQLSIIDQENTAKLIEQWSKTSSSSHVF